MNITLPNGVVINGVPEGTTKDQVMQKAISSGLATAQDFGVQEPTVPPTRTRGPQDGGTPFLQQAREAITGESKSTPQIRSMGEIGAAPELNQMSVPAFKASLGLLTTGDTDSLKGVLSQQFGDSVSFSEDEKGNAIVSLPSGSYALNQPGLSGQDVIRGAFDILSFTPAGRASSIPKAAGAAGLTQGAIETAEGATGGGFDPSDVVASAALGAGGKALEEMATTAYRAARGRAAGDVKEVTDFAESQDLPLMTSDVAEPKTFAGRSARALGEKIPVVGTGSQRAAQQEAREGLVTKASERFGQYSPSDVVTSLKNQTSRIKQAAGNRLSTITKKVSDAPAAKKSIEAIDKEIERLSTLPGGVERKTADQQTIDKLLAYRDDLSANPSFEAVRDLRTSFREDVKGERLAIPNTSSSAIERIYRSMSDDLMDTVGSSLGAKEASRWRAANRVYANELSTMKNTAIKNILQKGDITPETVNTMLYSSKPSDVKNLYNSLDSKGKEAARSGIIAKAAEKSGGSPDRFLNELNKLKAHVGVAFKGEDKAFVNGLTKYLDATREAGRSAVTTKSGQELFQIGAPVGVMADIGSTGGAGTAGAAAFGLASRAYESAPVRRLVARLASAPKGSTKFEEVSSQIQSALTASAQSAKEDQ